MSRARRFVLEAKTAFWLIPALSVLAAIGAGIVLPRIDNAAGGLGDLVFTGQADAARSVLSAIAGATVSVVGVAFSVTLVALTLAAQQLSPRVLRTFESNRLYQATLGLFLADFVYALLVLRTVRTSPPFVPGLSITLAIIGAVAASGLFVAFIGDIIRSLQPSEVIQRVADDGRKAIDRLFPVPVGEEADDAARNGRRADAASSGQSGQVHAPQAGFLVDLAADRVVQAAGRHDAIVRQRAPVGSYVEEGDVLAEVWPASSADGLQQEVIDAFHLAEQRTAAQDPAFPIRQLADIALRGLSPSLNDPTTAINAMNAIGDMLDRAARRAPRDPVRTDDSGCPRFVGALRDLDDLVRLGFDQVRRHATDDVTLCLRLLALLGKIRDAAAAAGGDAPPEAARQARLVCAGARATMALEDDADVVSRRYAELFGPGAQDGAPPGREDPAAATD